MSDGDVPTHAPAVAQSQVPRACIPHCAARRIGASVDVPPVKVLRRPLVPTHPLCHGVARICTFGNQVQRRASKLQYGGGGWVHLPTRDGFHFKRGVAFMFSEEGDTLKIIGVPQ